ncbi:MAG: PQQ-dependent sugar dehydrogenase [Streptosporangiales bacterium]|nr:PQQ-dependent sugar dehydrogenase [Streptosporangiales bacterium]
MLRISALLVLAAGLAAGCTGVPGTAQPKGTSYTPSPLPTNASQGRAEAGEPRVLARDLEVPWGVAFMPDGDALVTERDSTRLLRVTPSGEVSEVGQVRGAEPQGEGGLLGVAVSPSFARDRWVYAYYTSSSDNRIVRFRYRPDGPLGPQQVLVDGIPHAPIHNGGRLAFGPDGMLYAATGEAGLLDPAQDRDSLGGKILRMTPDGEPAPDNPFGSLVWSYGHRNVQGLAFDAEDRLYATEFGQNRFDEINRIRPGRNYGWPEVEGMGDTDGGRYTNPLLTWTTAEASPSGAAIAGGSLWVAALRGERLWQVPLGRDGKLSQPRALYDGEYGRLRTVVVAPSGQLWLTTSNQDGRGSPRDGDDKILVIPLRASQGR